MPNGPLLRLALVAGLVAGLGGCGGAQSDAAPDGDPLDTVTGEQLYERGVRLAGGGDYIRAEQYLAAAIERGFPEERAIPALMHVCVQADRLVAALGYAEPYLEQHPTEWSLRMLVASIHLGLGHDEQAGEQLERVIRDAPEEAPQAHYLLGVLHRDRLEDVEGARAHFRRYLALAPEGDHREEARAALSPEERGVPQRVPMESAPDVADPDDSSDESGAEAADAAADPDPAPDVSP